jgi:hypothetical protein
MPSTPIFIQSVLADEWRMMSIQHSFALASYGLTLVTYAGPLPGYGK